MASATVRIRRVGAARTRRETGGPACDCCAVEERVEMRQLARAELSLVGEIDRTEHIDLLYEQRGTELVERPGDWSASAWDPDGARRTLRRSKTGRTRALRRRRWDGVRRLRGRTAGRDRRRRAASAARGRAARVPPRHPDLRAAGIGSRLSSELEQVARGAGDSSMVVSATPSAHTVRFYQGRGYELIVQPLPELFVREPDDVHMRKCSEAHARSA